MCVPLRKNGNGTGRESMRVMNRVMGTGREPGIFLTPAIFLRIASESEKMFAKILDEFVGFQISQK